MNAKLFFFLLGISICDCRRIKFFRRDYNYIPEYDAFYKLHDIVSNWTIALEICDSEGASLFYPSDNNEMNILMENLNKNLETSFFIGIHNNFNVGEYITLDGNVTPMPLPMTTDELIRPVNSINSYKNNECLILDATGVYIKQSCNTAHSFICKKEDKSPCPTIDSEYKYKSGKCYKINKQEMLFMEAASTCFNERARLVIINDDNSAIISSLVPEERTEYHMGALKFPYSKMLTTTGIKLSHFSDENDLKCFKMKGRRDYNRAAAMMIMQSDCDSYLPFICEMDTHY